ncbi:hypothetical protein HmCmsJML009_02953 [Escherichia coli]|nr:hypothetical protein HmCmsJML009_02953 [Escherichia coli]
MVAEQPGKGLAGFYAICPPMLNDTNVRVVGYGLGNRGVLRLFSSRRDRGDATTQIRGASGRGARTERARRVTVGCVEHEVV